MSPIDFLDETAPNPMKVLGKSIVAWKGEGGAWAHRVLGVPLGADDAAIRNQRVIQGNRLPLRRLGPRVLAPQAL